ncbi:MAG: hypothetical protein ACJAYU_000208 [Bradymonadia bacterium]|jgi:hypothetical protein
MADDRETTPEEISAWVDSRKLATVRITEERAGRRNDGHRVRATSFVPSVSSGSWSDWGSRTPAAIGKSTRHNLEFKGYGWTHR